MSQSKTVFVKSIKVIQIEKMKLSIFKNVFIENKFSMLKWICNIVSYNFKSDLLSWMNKP